MPDEAPPVPPWIQVPTWPPTSLGWRMGPGENLMREWWTWADGQPVEAFREYLLAQRPIPEEWLEWVAEAYAHPAKDKSSVEQASRRLTASVGDGA